MYLPTCGVFGRNICNDCGSFVLLLLEKHFVVVDLLFHVLKYGSVLLNLFEHFGKNTSDGDQLCSAKQDFTCEFQRKGKATETLEANGLLERHYRLYPRETRERACLVRD